MPVSKPLDWWRWTGQLRNSEKMLEDLLNLECRERQGEITQQVLELISARFASFDEE